MVQHIYKGRTNKSLGGCGQIESHRVKLQKKCATTVYLLLVIFLPPSVHIYTGMLNKSRSAWPIHTHTFFFLLCYRRDPLICVIWGKATRRHFNVAFSHSCIWHCCWNKFKEYSECLISHVTITECMSFLLVYEVICTLLCTSCSSRFMLPVVEGVWAVVSAVVWNIPLQEPATCVALFPL